MRSDSAAGAIDVIASRNQKPENMEAMRRMIGLYGALTVGLLMADTAQAGPGVRISGAVIKPENGTGPVTIVVRDAEGDTVWRRTSRAADFRMKLPGDRIYTIAFSQPQCIRKEVVIDARHALRPGSKMKVRKVYFEVMLEMDPNAELRYAGPVGHIAFDKGSGRLRVRRDYEMEKSGGKE